MYVHSTLEAALEKHAAHPVLAPSYNPAMLARAPRLESDIAHILDVPEAEWKAHPIHVALQTSFPPALGTYLARIRQLSGDDTECALSPEPERLLAHSYVRYVGDLSGGQVIRRVIAKAYHLEDGLGTTFYGFSKLGSSGESSRNATVGDMGKIKDWFREGMDEGVGSDDKLKCVIVDEAVQAFKLNIALLSSLKRPVATVDQKGPGSVAATPQAPVEGLKQSFLSFFTTSR